MAIGGHAERLLVDEILRTPAANMRARAERLANASALSQQGITHEYRRLSSLCAVRISSFERKQFANLSHAASKAMNLNSYLGLIGRSFPSSRSRMEITASLCAQSPAGSGQHPRSFQFVSPMVDRAQAAFPPHAENLRAHRYSDSPSPRARADPSCDDGGCYSRSGCGRDLSGFDRSSQRHHPSDRSHTICRRSRQLRRCLSGPLPPRNGIFRAHRCRRRGGGLRHGARMMRYQLRKTSTGI